MTLDEFTESLAGGAPPGGLPNALVALWYDGKGDWVAAHAVAQEIDTPTGAWIHAYLHRKEGDLSNARYWYRRAGKPEALDELGTEWKRIAEAILSGGA